MNTNNYYNAKPAQITNLGQDLSGAKRHAFDTYETAEQKEAKAKIKAVKKSANAIKEQLKAELFKDETCIETVIDLVKQKYLTEYNFVCSFENIQPCLAQRRQEALADRTLIKSYNSAIKAELKTRRLIRDLGIPQRAIWAITDLKKKYSTKNTFKESNGITLVWKTFEETKLTDELELLATNLNALQFGNSVSDKERAYIAVKLAETVIYFKDIFPSIDIKKLGFCFGARGNNKSVAYYQNTQKLISVNRDNIGSLIHELGHFLDYESNLISSKIPSHVINKYKDKVGEMLTPSERHYYFDRKEIFARAFEQYCRQVLVKKFNTFALCGGSELLPDLCPYLIDLIDEALKGKV